MSEEGAAVAAPSALKDPRRGVEDRQSSCIPSECRLKKQIRISASDRERRLVP